MWRFSAAEPPAAASAGARATIASIDLLTIAWDRRSCWTAVSGVSSGRRWRADRDHDGRERAVEGAGGPGRDAGRLDRAVEGAMEQPELLVVGAVARLVQVEHASPPGPGLSASPADAAGGLDVLGRGLRLTLNEHQAEAGDVEADRDHVGGERHVDRSSARPHRSRSRAAPWRRRRRRSRRAR